MPTPAESASAPTPLPCSERKVRLGIFGGVFAITLLFAAYTQHVWEDYYITYRVSKNLAMGHGLVYTVGERIHTFTSPFNVLIPAGFSVVVHNNSDEFVLWMFRILSALLLGGAAVLLYDIARKNAYGTLATVVLLALFALDAKIVDFSINGQEVAFMMFFLAVTLHTVLVPSKHTMLKLALAGAGLMWTRPDGFIYYGAIALGFLLFEGGRSLGKTRAELLKIYMGAGIITVVLYLPWLLWAWHYFGSPVPHTIVAKAQTHSPFTFAPLDTFLPRLGRKLLHNTSGNTFLPAYALSFGGWHWVVVLYARLLAFVCMVYWCLPFAKPATRATSFAFMLGHLYLTFAVPLCFPWYVPNCEILGILVVAQVIQEAWFYAMLLKDKFPVKALNWQVGVQMSSTVVVCVGLALFLCAGWQLRVQQREIEEGTRKQIGLWLRQQAASSSESVFLEPLGYIGFFSQLKMLDTPGLCSEEVVQAEKLRKTSEIGTIVPDLHADWLVLRPAQVEQIQGVSPKFLEEQYTVARVFDASDRIAKYSWLPGRGYLKFDQKFVVFKRNKKGV